MCSWIKLVCVFWILPFLLYFAILGLSPDVFKMYVEHFTSFGDVAKFPSDPLDITDMEEVWGVHSFEETLPYSDYGSQRMIIFRNFTDCAKTFEEKVYPGRADKFDEYADISYVEGNPGNVYMPGVARTGTYSTKTLRQLLDDASPDAFASFLKIFDKPDFKHLLNATDKSVKRFKIDTSFVSHFPYPLVSTRIHSAVSIYTYALQCYGTKSWLFWPSTVLNKYKHHWVVHPHGVMIAGSPTSIVRIPTVRGVAGPNDLMVFPPLHFHVVATTAGKNLMFALRRHDKYTMLGSFRQSFTATVLSVLRKLYDSPELLFKRESEKLDENGKVSFHHAKAKQASFEKVWGRHVAESIPDEWRNLSQMELFNLPEHEWTNKLPSRMISPYYKWDAIVNE